VNLRETGGATPGRPRSHAKPASTPFRGGGFFHGTPSSRKFRYPREAAERSTAMTSGTS
jgi:ribosomal protein L4